jgi:hypothetical protein
MSNNAQSQNVSKQLGEVTELIHTYQQKIAVLNEELEIVKHQLLAKDKEMDQLKIQLKNLKRSRSSESNMARRQLNAAPEEATGKEIDPALDKIASLIINSTSSKYTKDDNLELVKTDETALRAKRAQSVDSSENSKKQIEMAQDEIKLLRNKIQRLEDDLALVTQVRKQKTFITFYALEKPIILNCE